MSRPKPWAAACAIALALAAALFAYTRPAVGAWLFDVTGEENRLAQVRALWNIGLDALRPALNLAPDAAIAPSGLPPHGVNTFLEQEVEPAKRERQFRMIKDAGFAWVRQEFPWEDIEIDAKGDFTDRRNPASGSVSAWDKYDNIVSLAEAAGLRMIVRLSAPPRWAHAGFEQLGTRGPPARFEDFADYVEAVAMRYKGRISHWQVWNEPNIFPEWGNQTVNPEDYARLLCLAHERLKRVDPANVVIAAALATNVEQGGANMSDLIFLNRMYLAGAGKCFDVMSAQGYGLFSGPGDRRLNWRHANVARHTLLRDVMVSYGDAGKPIWLAEMNWNAVPDRPGEIADVGRFGMVSEDEQARYVVEAFERAAREWPWVGPISVWFFKRASDAERSQSWYYFRMVEPDFTPLPVYDAMRRHTRGGP